MRRRKEEGKRGGVARFVVSFFFAAGCGDEVGPATDAATGEDAAVDAGAPDAAALDGGDPYPTAEDLVAAYDPMLAADQLDARIAEIREAYAPFQRNLYADPEPAREVLGLDGPWRLGIDGAGSQSSNGVEGGWFDPDFDDSGWAEVTLPHWAELNRAWYRKSFDVVDPADGRRRLLAVEDVDQEVHVWLNGQPVLDHAGYIRARLEVDVTDELRAGDNLVAIEVVNFWDPLRANGAQISVHDGTNGRRRHGPQFGNVAGLGAVRIVSVGEVHVGHLRPVVSADDRALRGLVVRPDAAGGRLEVGLQVRNETDARVDGELVVAVHPRNFEGPVSSETEAFSVPAGGLSPPRWIDVELEDPRVWTLEEPWLYEVEVTLRGSGGAVLDRVHDRAGLRDVGMTDRGGVLLDGEEVFLRGGVAQGVVVAPTSRAAAEEAILLVKAANLNALKTAQPAYLDLADQYGILVYLDLPTVGQPYQWIEDTAAYADLAEVLPVGEVDDWTAAEWDAYRAWFDGGTVRAELRDVLVTQLHEMIDRSGGHPSVALYAVTHETDAFAGNMALWADLFRAGRELDPTRITVPNSGRTYVPGWPYDERGCLDEESCWRILDHHSHESWYFVEEELDYWNDRTRLHFDHHAKPPPGDEGALSFWGDGEYKAIFSELAGAEALPVWETIEEWSAAGILDPPLEWPDERWNPTCASPIDPFLAGEDLDDALFRTQEERDGYAAVLATAGRRFQIGDAWATKLGADEVGDCNDPGYYPPRTISEWIQITQGLQATALDLSVDALRRMHDRVAGTFAFAVVTGLGAGQFPKGLVDEAGRPKLGYFLLAQASAPVRVQIVARDPGPTADRPFDVCIDRSDVEIWVINDTWTELPGHRIHVFALSPDGAILDAASAPVEVAPFRAAPAIEHLPLDVDSEANVVALLTDPAGRIVDGDFLKRPSECP
ncbi:MAG: hypothetical protein HYY06_03505 [Deltaproteobacteria bacterium]|nr:hypothetical protein [Deltaproteobacteria bacterium]